MASREDTPLKQEETKEATKKEEIKPVETKKDEPKNEPSADTKSVKEEDKKPADKKTADGKTADSKATDSKTPDSKSPASKTPSKTPDIKTTEKSEENSTKTPDDGASTDGNEERPGTPKGPTLREQFKGFSKFGDSKSDGKLLTLSQSDKWMKQAKVIDGKTITTTDTAICFKKFKQMKIVYPDYEKYLADLSKSRNTDLAAMKDKLRNCGTPGLRGTTTVAKGGAFERLTDTQKYTGSHKQRFDPEGKGKGVAGRKDLPDKSGYVSGYKNKDTYSKTH